MYVHVLSFTFFGLCIVFCFADRTIFFNYLSENIISVSLLTELGAADGGVTSVNYALLARQGVPFLEE